MGTVLGVDGCKGGWVGAEVGPSGVTWWFFSTAGDFLAHPTDVVAVDIPIGLPDRGRRACDEQARAALPGQASSVFTAPVRAARGAATYAEAKALSVAVDGRSLSAQCFGILPKIAEVDRALRAHPGREVIEVHPEVSFARLAGHPLPRKRSAAGALARLQLLAKVFGELPTEAPSQASLDDCLDALACAWTGQRWLHGLAEVLGGAEHDATGQVMRIVA